MRACDDLVYAAVLSAARAEQRLVDDADDRAGFREVVGAQVGSHAEALAACVAGEANEAVLDVPLQRDVAPNACGTDQAPPAPHPPPSLRPPDRPPPPHPPGTPPPPPTPPPPHPPS